MPSFELGELTPGQADFANLPKNVQERLLKRQQNKGEDQWQVKLSSVVRNYLYIAVLLCWFGYLYVDADGAKWKGHAFVVRRFYFGCGCSHRTQLHYDQAVGQGETKATLYVTPIYFLKTEFDIVSFRPIWTLKDFSVTHNYKNAWYQNSNVVLKFEGYIEYLSLSSKQKVETMFERIRTYDTRLRTAYANRDQQYFINNDDFYRVLVLNTDHPLMSKGRQAFIYFASVSLFAQPDS